MYLWVALWVPSLQDTLADGDAPLPLGRVFSSFMAAMSLGSLLYNAILYRFGPISASEMAAAATRGSDERAPLLPADGVEAVTPLAQASQTVAFHARLGCALLVFSGEWSSAVKSRPCASSLQARPLTRRCSERLLGLHGLDAH